jgi:hypothetical protein
VASAGARYFGFVVLSPTAAKLEEVALRWTLDVLGPPECGVGYATCATQADFSGLAAARLTLLARQGWNVEAPGLFGAPPIKVAINARKEELNVEDTGCLQEHAQDQVLRARSL